MNDGTEEVDGTEDLLESESLVVDQAEFASDETESFVDNADVDVLLDALETRIADRFDSIADKRVNALLKEIRKQGDKQVETVASGGSGNDVRAMKLAAREYLTDEIRFLGADERSFAMDLVNSLCVSKPNVGADEETAGREIASEVAARVKAVRKMYETSTVAALKKKGALSDRAGTALKQDSAGGSSTSEFSKGAEIASRIRPSTQA